MHQRHLYIIGVSMDTPIKACSNYITILYSCTIMLNALCNPSMSITQHQHLAPLRKQQMVLSLEMRVIVAISHSLLVDGH